LVVGAVEKVEIPRRLRDFQAQWESPALGLFHGAACSTALLPINCRAHPHLICPGPTGWKRQLCAMMSVRSSASIPCSLAFSLPALGVPRRARRTGPTPATFRDY